MPLETLGDLFLEVAARDQPRCLLHKRSGSWAAVSSQALAEQVRRLAAALDRLGIGRGDRVALMADSGPHWPAVDFATLSLGAALVPIYPTLLPEEAAYIARDSGARLLFVQGDERCTGLLGCLDRMSDVERLVVIDGDAIDGCESYDELCSESGLPPAELEERISGVGADELATLIYTSGTTGKPKGVMLTHGNIVSNLNAIQSIFDFDASSVALSFLPLSHSLERTVDYVYFHRGCTIAYAESVHTVVQAMGEVRPHLFVSVPRVYEKFHARVLETVSQSSRTRRRLFGWATRVGEAALEHRLAGRPLRGLAALRLALAHRLVFRKLHQRLGGRFRYAVSGGAPLSPQLARFFWAAGIEIYEGYGLTETSPVIAVNRPGAVKLGTVGKPIPDVEVRIADDGEILVEGPNIMQGYFGQPEATSEVLDDEGWLHTGDIGELDGGGFLRITDRKKELIVNAYGKNIAPAPIENTLKTSRFIEHAVVVGDRRKFLAALLAPDFEALYSWAAAEGLEVASAKQLVTEKRVLALLDDEIEVINERLSHHEQIHAWHLLENELSLESGELTPTQKVKRRVVERRYEAVIDRMYASA